MSAILLWREESPHWAFMAYHPEIRQFMARNPSASPMPAQEAGDPISVALRYSRGALTRTMGDAVPA